MPSVKVDLLNSPTGSSERRDGPSSLAAIEGLKKEEHLLPLVHTSKAQRVVIVKHGAVSNMARMADPCR